MLFLARRRSVAPGKEKMMNPEEIGRNIRRYRLKRGMTQEALAERAGITPVYVSQIETGVRRASLPVLLRITEALDTHIAYLLTGDAPCNAGNLAELMGDCSERERQIIIKVAAAAKDALRESGSAA